MGAAPTSVTLTTLLAWRLRGSTPSKRASRTKWSTASAGPMVNTGEGKGIAFIERDTAIFKPDGAEAECRITMKFTGGKLLVTQEGVCGFGLNVTAAGTYRKVSASSSRKKPSRFISSA